MENLAQAKRNRKKQDSKRERPKFAVIVYDQLWLAAYRLKQTAGGVRTIIVPLWQATARRTGSLQGEAESLGPDKRQNSHFRLDSKF